MKKKKDSEVKESKQRWTLALIITSLSILGIILISIFVICLAKNQEQASQIVLTAVLPLIAAWVSTVLAYYYSSESVEAATKSVKALISPEEKLKSTIVKDKMIKISEMVYFTYSDELNVLEILAKLKASGKGFRLPFLGDKKQPEFILHKSAIDEALVELAQKEVNIATLTLKELLNSVPNLKALAEGAFGTVVETASLAEAKAVMNGIKNAQDVFVTDNGKKDGVVIGWITNVIIEASSRV